MRDAFLSYVEHERSIRNRLQSHRDSGLPLSEWRRAFLLDTALQPTRRQVLDLYYRQDMISDGWFQPKVPHGTDELLNANRSTVSHFLQQFAWTDAPGDARRTPDQVHLVAYEVPLRRAYEELLTPLRLTVERDSQIFTGVLLQIEAYLADPNNANETCTIYQMSRGNTRQRSVNDDQEIPTLFQGANYADATRREMIYPGDDRERAADGVTIQVHTLQVRQTDRGAVIADNVPTIAVWLPQNMAQGWLVQART